MDFSRLETEIDGILANSNRALTKGGARERLQALCDWMRERVPHYDWFGFYVARKSEPLLDLGPFAGEQTEHVLIPFGRGICGQAAQSREIFLVDDVSAASNYLACSLKVKSEIVVPVMEPASGEVAGEIDIDSHTVAAFGSEDRAFLEELAAKVAADVAALRR
jgi:GAF domain-containing protein